MSRLGYEVWVGALFPVPTGSEGFRSRTLSNLNRENGARVTREGKRHQMAQGPSHIPDPVRLPTEAHTCLQRVSSLCLFLFFRSTLVRDGLKSKSSKSAQSSESFVDLETSPHLLLLFGLISPFLCSSPARIFCVHKEKEKAIVGINEAHPRVMPTLNFLGPWDIAFTNMHCLSERATRGNAFPDLRLSPILHRLCRFSS